MRKYLKRFFILLTIAALMLAVIGCSKDEEAKENKNNLTLEQRVIEAMVNQTKTTDMHMLSNMSMNIDEDFLKDTFPDTGMNSELFKMLSNIDISGEVKMVLGDTPDYFMSYNLNYKTFPLLTLDVYFNEEGMAFSISNFYDKVFSMNFDELLNMDALSAIEVAEEFDNLDFNKYLDIIKKVDSSEVDKDTYEAFVEAHLKEVLSDEKIETLEYTYDDEKFESEVTVVTYHLNLESLLKLTSEIAEFSEEDSALKDYAKNLIKAVVDEMIDSKDYKLLGQESEDLESILETIEDDFDTPWAETFKSITEGLETALEDLEDPDEDLQSVLDTLNDNIEIKLYMDKDNHMKKMAFNIEAEGLDINYDMIVHDTEQVEIKHPKDTLNLMDLVLEQGDFETEDERNKFIVDLLKSGIKTLNEAEGYQAFIDDLEPFEDILGMTTSDMRMALGMAGVFIEEITFEDLKGMFNLEGSDDYDDYDDGYGYDSDLQVAFITDGYDIFDEAMNQVAYEGLETIASMYEIDVDYYMPISKNTENLIETYEDAIMSGYNTLVVSGSLHAQAIYQAQYLYPEVHFIILDAQPLNPESEVEIADNTVAVLFDEGQAGFLAGVASALETSTGQLGFMGGMENPSNQNYGWGYVAGVAYSNYMYDSEASVSQYLYQDSFDDIEDGYELATEIYKSGVDVLFSATGDVSEGALTAAKQNNEAGNLVFYVGSNLDVYEQGYTDDGFSIVLTSAIKHFENAAYTLIESIINETFPGGQALVMDVKDGGVGLPYYNLSLTYETDDIIYDVTESLISEEVIVPRSLEALKMFLQEFEYKTPAGVNY